MRVARAPTSVRISKVESLASRISPPGTIDCSGSHWRTVPLIETVLTAFRVSAPPIAWTARFTRSWLYDVAGALATTTSDKARSETTRFMGLPPAIWMAATLRIGHLYVKAGKATRRRSRFRSEQVERSEQRGFSCESCHHLPS